MAIRSGFFNSVNGDRKYDANRFAEYFATFIGNGVFPNPSSGLQIMSNNDMTVTIKEGTAWINGWYMKNTDDHTINIEPADGVLSRIDRIVIRHDVALRDVFPAIKKGTFASSPVAPSLQRDADAYELGLADVYISKGIISITQANITDLRLNNDLCGVVHGTVDQVDVTTFFNQYTQGFELKKEEFEQEFMSWFATLEDVLDENTATNLFNMITATNDNLSNVEQNLADLSNDIDDLSDNFVAHKADYKSFKENVIKIKKEIIILATDWIDDVADSGFWKYDISDNDITVDTIVDINIHLTDLEKAESVKPVCLSGVGKVTIYAEEQLMENIKCDIKMVRQVVN